MEEKKKTTIILFSGDYDKAMAAYIIANGAAAYEHDVTIFHTFWGLNVLRTNPSASLKKGMLEKTFAGMMPKGAEKLGLSKMNFAGLGKRMLKKVIHKHQASDMNQLIKLAQEQGIQLVACTMTMDLLGLKKEELIEPVDYAGVGAYLGEAEQGNINLFI